MLQVPVFNIKGDEVERLELAEALFGLSSNNTLVHQVYVALMANIRGVYAHTKTRSEVAGSGKKPWKQKGTGRARVGSVRNPVWRKGGIVFGPRNDRNYSQKVNQKMRRKAVMIALSDKIRSGKVILIDELSFVDKKTKHAAQALKALKLDNKNIAFAFAHSEREFEKMTKNIDRLSNILIENMNVLDIMNHQYLVLSKNSVKYLEEKFTSFQK